MIGSPSDWLAADATSTSPPRADEALAPIDTPRPNRKSFAGLEPADAELLRRHLDAAPAARLQENHDRLVALGALHGRLPQALGRAVLRAGCRRWLAGQDEAARELVIHQKPRRAAADSIHGRKQMSTPEYWILDRSATRSAGTRVFFRDMTGIGPRFTRIREEAMLFPSRQAAQAEVARWPAMIFEEIEVACTCGDTGLCPGCEDEYLQMQNEKEQSGVGA